MLRLKIGNTNIAVAEADIPVVLRSPLFRTSDDKIAGSFIFNFTLPFTDQLKTELAFAHRPARKGKPTIDKPFELSFGPLYFAGTATVTELSALQVEVSMPVDTGDIAKTLRNKTLRDLDLDQQVTFEPKISYSQITVQQDFFFEESNSFLEKLWIHPNALRFDTLGMLDMGTFEWTIPYNGTFNIKAVINCKFGTITMLGETFPAGNIRAFEMYKNGVRVYAEVIEGDSYGYQAAWELLEGDVITFCVSVDSVPAYGFHYVIFYILGGTTIAIDDGQSPFGPETSNGYPDHNYTAFPVNNPVILGNVPESLYQIDFASLKEQYEQFAPYINYFIDNKFPYVIMGEKNGIWYAMLNLFSPFPYLAYIIKKFSAFISYNIVNNLFETPDLKQLTYLHNFFINNYFYEDTPIYLSEFVPEEPLSDFFRNICSALGIAFKVDSTRRKITFKFIEDIMTDSTAVEFSQNISAKPVLQTVKYSGYSAKYTAIDCDYLKKYVKSLDGITQKGSVALVNDLSAISDPEINDGYYVTTRHAWYIWNYDPELGILNWIFHTFGFALEIKDIDEESEEEPFTLENKINTSLMDYFDPVDGNGDKTISAPPRDWHVPLVHHAGNFRQLPETYRGDYIQGLLLYCGKYNDSNGHPYPFATNSVYDFAGTRIANLGMTLDGDYGIFNKKLKKFVEFMLASPGDFVFNKHLSPLELANLDFFRWHRIHGTDFLLKEVRFNIRRDHISTAEITAIRRNI
ncbi:MAG: hypothetical protein AB7C90_01705 [Bacteroidales bacterium]